MNGNTGSQRDERLTIFLLEEDTDAQLALKENLRQRGFRVLVTVSMEDALEWLSTGYISADLVLVDLMGKSTEEALEVGHRLRSIAKYNGHTPLIVMAEKYDKDVEGTDVNVEGNDWVFYLGEEPGQLHDLIRRLTAR
jgi:DNA-binding response OmpR family regulator